eukprot:SAG31_NODE_20689_length_567_cov_4.448718_1_plen_85_part_10
MELEKTMRSVIWLRELFLAPRSGANSGSQVQCQVKNLRIQSEVAELPRVRGDLGILPNLPKWQKVNFSHDWPKWSGRAGQQHLSM